MSLLVSSGARGRGEALGPAQTGLVALTCWAVVGLLASVRWCFWSSFERRHLHACFTDKDVQVQRVHVLRDSGDVPESSFQNKSAFLL